jgi:hypothetical protein
MDNMKLIMESWSGYLSEADEGKTAGMTWGQLGSALKAAHEMRETQISQEKKVELAKTLGREGFKLAVSFTGPIGGALSATMSVGEAVAKMFSTVAQQPDQTTEANPFLAAMNISDSFQELIDDNLEDKFVKEILPQIEKMATSSPNQQIPNMDVVIRDWLKRQQIGGTTGNTVEKGN